jgi:hypothetical protein
MFYLRNLLKKSEMAADRVEKGADKAGAIIEKKMK